LPELPGRTCPRGALADVLPDGHSDTGAESHHATHGISDGVTNTCANNRSNTSAVAVAIVDSDAVAPTNPRSDTTAYARALSGADDLVSANAGAIWVSTSFSPSHIHANARANLGAIGPAQLASHTGPFSCAHASAHPVPIVIAKPCAVAAAKPSAHSCADCETVDQFDSDAHADALANSGADLVLSTDGSPDTAAYCRAHGHTGLAE
jgi:hypothetical protein